MKAQQLPDLRTFVDVRTAADILGVAGSRIHQLADAGHFPGRITLVGRLFLPRAEVEAAKGRNTKPGPKGTP